MMHSNYPPGVSGREPQISGEDYDGEDEWIPPDPPTEPRPGWSEEAAPDWIVVLVALIVILGGILGYAEWLALR